MTPGKKWKVQWEGESEGLMWQRRPLSDFKLQRFPCLGINGWPWPHCIIRTLASMDFSQRKTAAGEGSWLKVRWEPRFL